MKDMRHITRMDYPRSKGWWVRIYASREVLSQQMFSDGIYGGSRKALAVAKAWRNEQEEKFARKIASSMSIEGRKIHACNSRNHSGVVGVAPEVSKARDRVVAWRASWTTKNGERNYERFPVSELGYRSAFRRAVEKRYKVIGKPVPNVRAPEEKDILRALDD